MNKLAQLTYRLFGSVFILSCCLYSSCQKTTKADSIIKVEMRLSAFGVESDDYPSIDVTIDFMQDTSYCSKWFYNPSHKPSTYKLSIVEMKKVLELLHQSNLKKLKSDYTTNASDEPTSITTIYTSSGKYVIRDYGLKGDYPLQELYKLVYKL
jgi:hypothetical protein